jgi:formylglycine-generating enzyme required for sulfatase activity
MPKTCRSDASDITIARPTPLGSAPANEDMTMIAILTSVWNWTVDTAHFASAVYRDARALQAEAEETYGPLGF